MKFYNIRAKEIRKNRKIKLKELAETLCCSTKTISRWESGEITPSSSDIRVLSIIYDIPLNQLSNIPQLNIKSEHNLSGKIKGNLENINKLESLLKSQMPTYDEESIKLIERIKTEITSLTARNKIYLQDTEKAVLLFNSIDMLVYIKDKKRAFRRINQTFIEYMPGIYNRDDILGYTAMDLFGKNEVLEIVHLETEVFNTGTRIVDVEISIPGSKGSKIGLISIFPIFNRNDAVEEIMVSIKDITKTYNKLSVYKHMDQALNELEEAIYIRKQQTSEIIFISNGVKNITGYEPKSFYNSPFLFDSIFKNRILSEASNKLEAGTYHYEINASDGTKKMIKEKISLRKDSEDSYTIYGIIYDVS